MKASMTILIAIVSIGTLGLVAGDASACGGHKGGFSFSYGYNNFGYSHRPKVYVKKVYVAPVYERCYHPHFSVCVVLPGDTWFTLSQRIYGTPVMWKHIASFNGLGLNGPLPIGQQLRLPVINADGTLGVSTAGAAPANFGQPGIAGALPAGLPGQGIAPEGQPIGSLPQFGQPNVPAAPQMNAPNAMPTAMPSELPAAEATRPATPAANIRVATPEESLPSVAIGSILMLDGESLGDSAGSVRMLVNGLALPVKVLDWNANGAKIQLPQLELAKAIEAQIEVIRADGSLASKSAINLTPAATRLALGN